MASEVLDTEITAIEYLLDILISSQYSEALIGLCSDSLSIIESVKQKILLGYWSHLHIIFFHIPRKYNDILHKFAKKGENMSLIMSSWL